MSTQDKSMSLSIEIAVRMTEETARWSIYAPDGPHAPIYIVRNGELLPHAVIDTAATQTIERVECRDRNDAYSQIKLRAIQYAVEDLGLASPARNRKTYQADVMEWMVACFGTVIPFDRDERNHRFLEEALELVQACSCSREAAHQLVDYVFDRPAGEMGQEVGGTAVTLAALCGAHGLDLGAESEAELRRIWAKKDAIRAKQASKPAFGPLPGPSVGGGNG